MDACPTGKQTDGKEIALVHLGAIGGEGVDLVG
jgi:hypothetical protein